MYLDAAGLKDPRLPIGNFLFLGTTGVGKTELAKKLAEKVYGSSAALLQFDMSKYQHQSDVSSFVGTSPGYVGYNEGGLLTNAILKNKNLLILLDEIEKAHPAMYKLLLSIMGSGEITDNKGNVALFNRSIIIATSNLCSMQIQELFKENFPHEQIEEMLRPEFMKHFSPEFYGRVSPIIFSPISKMQTRHIVDKLLGELQRKAESAGIYLNIDESVKQYIEEKGITPELGFRPTTRFIEQKVSLPIAQLLVETQVQEGQGLDVKFHKPTESIKIEQNKYKHIKQVKESQQGPVEASRQAQVLNADNKILSPLELSLSQKNLVLQIEIRSTTMMLDKNKLTDIKDLLVVYENIYKKSSQMSIWPEEFSTLPC